MDIKEISIQKIVIILFVLIISMGICWYGEKAVEKFMANNKAQTI